MNNTNIDFTPHELALLNKGLKYNLHYKQKQWVKTLAMEAETALGQLPLLEQEPIRYQVYRNIQHLFNTVGKQQYKNSREHNEKRVLRSIKEKLTENDATIIKADKGNAIIMTYLTSCRNKILKFINDNNFTHIGSDLTKKYQHEVRASINKCPHVIPATTKWRYVNMNSTSACIRGLIKIHKPDSRIRPIINCVNAPVYRLAKRLVQFITTHLPLPNAYNVKNSLHLVNDLYEIPWTQKL
jgi:hypothetical protein